MVICFDKSGRRSRIGFPYLSTWVMDSMHGIILQRQNCYRPLCMQFMGLLVACKFFFCALTADSKYAIETKVIIEPWNDTLKGLSYFVVGSPACTMLHFHLDAGRVCRLNCARTALAGRNSPGNCDLGMYEEHCSHNHAKWKRQEHWCSI